MQPTRRQVPPSSGASSMQITLAPSWAARIAAVYPPGPPPRTATSHFIAPIVSSAECAAVKLARNPSRDVHHGRRSGERRVLRGDARAEAREEDREPGRPDRLPPVLCRREGQRGRRHHVLRVPGRTARPRRRRDGAPDRLPRRLGGGARLLGRTGGRRAQLRLGADPRSGGARPRARRRRFRRRAADRPSPGHPTRARPPRLRGRARLLVGLRAQRDVPVGTRLHAGLGGPRREAQRLLRLRRGARGARHVRRRHGPPRRLVVEARGARGMDREGALPPAVSRHR